MQGWLVVNAFYNSTKLTDIYNMLQASCAVCGMQLDVRTTADIVAPFGKPLVDKPDFAVFWDKDIVCARRLESQGVPVFNCARAIELCDNKILTAETLCGRVPVPDTVAAPKTFEGVSYNNLDFLQKAADTLGLPMVIKEAYGSYGKQVYLAETIEQAAEIVAKIGWKDFLMQRYIGAHKGTDIRMNVVGGTVTSAMLRHNPDDFRSNVSNGGTGTAYRFTQQQADVALHACRALGLDFGGVDILLDANDNPLVCEVNSNPHFLSTLAATGDDLSLHIAQHVKKRLTNKQ